MRAFDARCLGCDTVYVTWVHWSQREGDYVDYALAAGCRYCGPHTLYYLRAECSGLSDNELWGPDG